MIIKDIFVVEFHFLSSIYFPRIQSRHQDFNHKLWLVRTQSPRVYIILKIISFVISPGGLNQELVGGNSKERAFELSSIKWSQIYLKRGEISISLNLFSIHFIWMCTSWNMNFFEQGAGKSNCRHSGIPSQQVRLKCRERLHYALSKAWR